ncbi:MAG: hypothetical protein GX594_09690 [Pirellulaceae bacterium]|nr:hypothetical protein [Pirellulaceae bacterium]
MRFADRPTQAGLRLRRRDQMHMVGHDEPFIMPNHWHFVLWPRGDGDISEFMRWLTVTHTQRCHAAHRTAGRGPLYQGRFKSFPIQEDDNLWTVRRYV